MVSDGAREAVEAAGIRRYEAMVAADAVALGELLCDDLTVFHGGGHRDDKSSYLATIASGYYREMKVDSYLPERIWVIGDTAVVPARLTASGRAGEHAMAGEQYATLSVWCHRDGRWQLLVEHATYVPEPDQN